MQRRLKIALVTGMLPVEHDRTRGRYIYETAKALSRITDVRVYLQQIAYLGASWLRPRSNLYGRLNPEYAIDGIDVEAYEYPGVQGISRPLNGWISSRYIERRVRAWRPDVLLSYWLYPEGYGAALAARRIHVPVVVGALGSDVHRPGRVGALFGRAVVRRADAIMAVSRDMRSVLVEEFGARPEKCFAVVNGYDSSVFRIQDRLECRRNLGLGADTQIILYVGRLYAAKGLVELLAAFRRLRQARPGATLVFLGDGVMAGELRQRVEEAGLQGSVLLPGGVEPQGVATWMGAANLVCLPSWSEGYPNVLVEAVASGRPVVATDVGGTSEIVSEVSGRLVPPKDVEALTAALDEVLSREWNPGEIAGSLGRSWDDVARETLDVCRFACGHAGQ